MPIDKETKPNDWKTTVRRILKRAENMCQRCLKPDGKEVYVVHRDGLQYWMRKDGGRLWRNEFGEYEMKNPPRGIEPEVIMVELSVVHYNHDSADARDVNLKAFCQYCQLVHEKSRQPDLEADMTDISGATPTNPTPFRVPKRDDPA